MRFRLFALLTLVAAAGFLTLSLTHGQERPVLPQTSPTPSPAQAPQPAPPPVIQTGGTAVPAVEHPAPAAGGTAARDLAKLPEGQKQVLLSCRRGADFLVNMKRLDGRFRYGFVPALGRDLERDDYLCQVGAAFALARAARFTGDKRYDGIATQAILALLDETTMDEPKDRPVRHTTLPSVLVNRLGSAALLVLAINELPAPQPDLLDKSDQLCNFIRKQARADGSLAYAEPGADGKAVAEDAAGINEHPGAALYALMASQRHRPAAWKTELVRKAAGYYLPWWRKHPDPAFVPWQTAAYAEAYLTTKERAFAEAINEMNDWVCDRQYTQTDASHPEWRGGFRGAADAGKAESAPDIGSAAYAEGLAQACRVARQAGDVKRFDRYAAAAGECVHFLALLQYAEGNSSHFDESYRKRFLLGGFFASHQDGNLRLDYTQHAVSAMVLYLEWVAK